MWLVGDLVEPEFAQRKEREEEARSHGSVREYFQGPVWQEGDANPYGRAGRRRENDNTVQTEAGGDCHHDPHYR